MGLFWSFVDNLFGQGLNFTFGLVLARLLSPKEFGLMGMMAVFIAVAQVLIESGFVQALVRKEKCTTEDYSTVFFFNIFTSFFIYFILFISSNSIAIFFDEPTISNLLKILCLSIILDSFSIVQRTILIRKIDFKTQTRVSIISSFTSGLVALYLAVNGFGVLSLVYLVISRSLVSNLLLWGIVKWVPIFTFSKESFKSLFSFGSKLLVSSLFNTLFINIYSLIIGKYFSFSQLGYYNRAKQFSDFPSQNFNNVVQRVSFPILSKLQNDKDDLKRKLQIIIKSTMFISFLSMFLLSALSESLIITLIGEKWRYAIFYLQLLCFSSSLYPLQSLNLSVLKVFGRSDLFLRLEVIKIILALPFLFFGIKLGIEYLIIGQFFTSLISFFLNSYWSKALINYSSFEQLKNISGSFFFALIISGIVYIVGKIFHSSIAPMILFYQVVAALIIFFTVGEVFKKSEYEYLKNIFLEYVKI